MQFQTRQILIFISVFFLAACGGGGSGGGGSGNTAPVAVASGSPDSGEAPLTVTFSGTASNDSDGSISSYAWSFGDGSSGQGSTTSHTYDTEGNYTATLTVTDNDGATGTDTVSVQVSASNAAPTASFTATPTSGTPPLSVDFDASGSTDSDGSIASYAWNFGDGNNGTGATTSHTYDTDGSYTAILTVTDDDGATATDSQEITVSGTSYSVSGSISVTSNHVPDSDVNDPYAAYSSNDAVGSEQVLPNPAIVGGFSSKVGTGGGPNGDDRFTDTGDEVDLFLAQLVPGQTIALSIAAWDDSSPNSNDLDLCLYDSSTYANVECSAGVNDLESIEITQAMIDASTNGEFIIEVYAYAGISNYTLTISDATSPTLQSSLSLQAGRNFIPGEVIVRMNDGVQAGDYAKPSRQASSLGLAHKAGGPGRAMLYSADTTEQMQEAKTTLGMESIRPSSLYAMTDPESRRRLDTIALVKALWQRDDVESAGLNYIHQPLAVPADPSYSLQWHYRQINLEQAWDITTGETNDITVAVVDTGVFLAHEDLSANLVSGYDFISSTSISNDGDGIDPDADDPGDNATPGSSSWHGTHVAGTIGAATNNSVGIAGVSWGANLMPIRVLGVGGGTSYDIIQGIRYAAGLSNDSGTVPANPADVLNLSLGCQDCYNATEEAEYQAVRDSGAIIIAAAGNSNTSTPGYPASYGSVVSVSSVRPDKTRAYYSNYGQYIALAAPGGETSLSQSDGVLSTLVDDSSGVRDSVYKYYQGTSMAAPHVAGVVALMKDVHPGMTPGELDNLIAGSVITEDIGAAGRDDFYGYGLIDARKAVEAALDLAGGGSTAPAVLTINPSQLGMGLTGTTSSVTLSATGDENLNVTGVSSNAAWLSAAAASVDGKGLGSYDINVDRTDLSPASYRGRVTFTADNGSSTYVEVTMSVGSDSVAGDAGLTYVLLVDPDTNDTVDQDEVTAGSGVYLYSFDTVSPGDYLIIAGSDMDNDYLICDAGEACGGYPLLGQMEEITVDSDLTDLDFLINFDLRIINSSSASSDGEEEGKGSYFRLE